MTGQIFKNIIAQFALDIGGADHRDALRIKEITQAIRAGCRDFFMLRRFTDKHPGVNGDITIRIQKQRIEIQFADFGIFNDQLRYFQKQLLKRSQIDGLAPIPFQNIRTADVFDHLRLRPFR